MMFSILQCIYAMLQNIVEFFVNFFGDYQFNNWFFDSVFISNILIPVMLVFAIELIVKISVKNRRKRMTKRFKEAYEQMKREQKNYEVTCQNPDLQPDYFRVDRTDAMFIIPFPEKWVAALKECEFTPVVIDDVQMHSNSEGKKIYQKLLLHLGDNGIPKENQDAFIQQVAEETAAMFVADIKARRVRFNKYLFGVRSITNKKDNSTIAVYETDYFSFKTMTNIYNKLKGNGNVILNAHPEFSTYYPSVPFLNSMGIGGFVIVDRGEGDEIVWGFRGPNCQSGGYWHFSYDETFTHDDKPKIDDAATLRDCIRRALTEELGIHDEDQEKKVLPLSQITLLDGGIIRTGDGDDRYEFESCSFVRICLTEQYTFDDFVHGYRYAKDAELETRCLRLVKIANLDAFMEEFAQNMSPEAETLARKIQKLWELGILPTDKEGLREIASKKALVNANQ